MTPKKGMALSILVTMVLGLAAWAGTSVVNNKVEIRANTVKIDAQHRDILEIKQDVKQVKQILMEKYR